MSDTTQENIRSPADRTVSRIREALAHGDTACVSQVLEVVQQMSGKVDHLSVQDLAEIIGRDLTTVARIMKAANCLGYNPAAVEVSTLPQAIGIIGFEAIRNLVISLLLMESAETRFGEEQSHNVAAAALSTAVMAKTVAERVPGLNPEQAFVCGALRHYGKLLLSTFMPDEYFDALELTREMGADKAYRTTCGLTPVELGLRILAESNLPKIIQHALEPAPADMIRSKKLSDSDKLVVVSDFAEKFCGLVDSPDLNNASYKSASEQLLKTYAPSLGLDEEGLQEVLAKVSHSLTTVGQAQGFTSFGSTIVNSFSRLAEGRPLEKWPAAPRSAETGQPATSPASDPLALGVAEIEKLVAANPVDARKAFTAAARAVRAGLRARSCLIFLSSREGAHFSAIIGVGHCFMR